MFQPSGCHSEKQYRGDLYVGMTTSGRSSPPFVDSFLSRNSHTALELDRAQVAEVRVAPLPIVEHLDVLEDLPGRLLTSSEAAPVYQLTLEGREEALHDRIVPAVALAGHAARDPSSRQPLW